MYGGVGLLCSCPVPDQRANIRKTYWCTHRVSFSPCSPLSRTPGFVSGSVPSRMKSIWVRYRSRQIQ